MELRNPVYSVGYWFITKNEKDVSRQQDEDGPASAVSPYGFSW